MKRGSRTPLSYFDRDREAGGSAFGAFARWRERAAGFAVFEVGGSAPDTPEGPDLNLDRAGVFARAAADTASSAHGCIDSASSSALSGGVQ